MTELTRRQWLRGTAVGVPGVFAIGRTHRAIAGHKRPALRLGFSLYGMKTLLTGDALRRCAQTGYDGVELALLPGWPTEPKRLTIADRRELRRQLADHGLALLGLMENLSEPAADILHRANLDRLKAAAELGQALSPAAPPVIETVLGGKPTQWDQVKERLAERLRAWAEIGAAAQTVIAVKPHVAHALHTPAGATWLVRQVQSPWLKLAFDYSHFALRNFPMAPTIATLVPESAFIHVKDAKGQADKFQFLLPGEGGTDYVAYFQQIQAVGYRGPVVVEVSGQLSNRPGYDPVGAARRSYAHLAPALRQAGVRRG